MQAKEISETYRCKDCGAEAYRTARSMEYYVTKEAQRAVLGCKVDSEFFKFYHAHHRWVETWSSTEVKSQ